MNEELNEVVYEANLDTSVQETVEQTEDINVADVEVDWKTQAIEARTRLEVLQEMQQRQNQQVAEPDVDEVTKLRHAIQQKREALPALDDKNPQSFWDRERAKEEINTLQERFVEARIKQQERVLVNQQVDGMLNQYKSQQNTRPQFKAVEAQFDQLVSRLEPHLRGNRTMLEMIRKNLEYDSMNKTNSQPKAPASTPNGAYQPQARATSNKGKVNWRSDNDRAVGEYYVERGIINGPEDFYAARFNERSPQANNNGVAIYDVPNKPRGWRR